jgi:hypothetical protein
VPDDDDDDEDEDASSEEEEGTSSRSNADLTRKARIISVVATEMQTFQLSKCTWDLLAVWKKRTCKTFIHMQIAMFVEKRF